MTIKSISTHQDQAEHQNSTAYKKSKNQAAIQLMEEWLADESGYEEEHGPQIEQAIKAASAKPWAK